MAVVIAAVLTSTYGAKADPGQGAVVTHIDPSATGEFWAIAPDGSYRVDIAITGRSDYYRLNPDGTLTFQTVEPKASITLSVPGGGGTWEPYMIGYGTLAVHALVDSEGNTTGESTYFEIQGQLTRLVDGSEWLLQSVGVEQDQEFKVVQIHLQPK